MELQKIKKDVARRAYNAGYEVVLLPSKVGLNSLWVQGVRASKAFQDIEFNSLVNSFEYYNCCSELGHTARFYISTADYAEYLKI